MDDKTKTCLSTFFFLSTLILPIVGFAIGILNWDFKTGLIIALCIFAFFFLLSGIMLAFVKVPSWLTVSLPFVFGTLYSLIPDLVIGPIDDAAAVASGAILTFALWLRKQPDTPKWIVLPLVSAGVYTLIGSFIPGPVDEIIVTAITAGVSVYGAAQLAEHTTDKQQEAPTTTTSQPEDEDNPNIIDGTFIENKKPPAVEDQTTPPMLDAPDQ